MRTLITVEDSGSNMATPHLEVVHAAWHVDDWPPQTWNAAASVTLGMAIALAALTVSLFIIWDIRLTVRIITGAEKRRQIEDYTARRAGNRTSDIPMSAPRDDRGTTSAESAARVNERLRVLAAGTAAAERNDFTQRMDASAHSDATTCQRIRPRKPDDTTHIRPNDAEKS